DPPFNSKATYNVLYQKKNGSASATQICSEGRVLGDGGGAGGIGAPLQKTDMNQIVLKAREVLALSPACSILYTVQKRAPENLPSNISGARERLARVVSARS
ncbi:MAG: hypothetical protein L6427_13385, partial [Actinomycetia bacterium]|nr:hypothetical protein [Actinomycetes bacterium]